MEIEYKGANCIVIKTKNTTLAVDTALSVDGGKDVALKQGVYLATQPRLSQGETGETTLRFDGPGEYEVDNLSIRGVQTRVYSDSEADGNRATMYRIDNGDVRVGVLGHVATPLSEDQLEALGVVDILVVPVGGGGFTLDSHQAAQVVRQISPKLVIPTHYADKQLSYEVPQEALEPFLKELSSPHETLPKLKLKSAPAQEALSVVVLERVG